MTELVGWRKYGHNELDEPRLTNPKLYKLVDSSVPTPDVWCRQLSEEQMNEVQFRVLFLSFFSLVKTSSYLVHYETPVKAAVNSAKASWMTSYDNVQSGNYSPPQLGRNFGPWSEISRASSNSTTQWDSGVDKVHSKMSSLC